MAKDLPTKFNASGILWWNAALFVDLCKQLEAEHQADFFKGAEWTPKQRVLDEQRAFAIAAVMHSMSALDAGINEFFHALESGDSGRARPVNPNFRHLLRHSWPLLAGDGKGTLDKFNCALKTAGRIEFDPGEPSAHGFGLLRRLRNAIVHFSPEWSNEDGDHARLQSSLSGVFADNALVSELTPWFPNRCFGSGCATWAVGVAEAFMREFCTRMEVPYWFIGWKYVPNGQLKAGETLGVAVVRSSKPSAD